MAKERSQAFISHLKNTYPEVDAEVVLKIFDSKYNQIIINAEGDSEYHDKKLEILNSDLNAALLFSTIQKYNQSQK